MRVLMKVSMPHDTFAELAKAGTVGAKLNEMLEAMKPEAAYFTEFDGKRTGIFVVDLADPSKIPSLAEPWFLTFRADVQFHTVMLPSDLQKSGLDELARKWA